MGGSARLGSPPAAWLTVQRGWDPARSERFDVVGRGYVYELREVTRCVQQRLRQPEFH